VEDQPTDTSELTETAETTQEAAPARAVPVGKRRGRHRSFRPLPAVDTQPDETVGAESRAPEPADEATSDERLSEEPKASDERLSEEQKAGESTAEPAPKVKRRRWFRRAPAAAVTDAAVVEDFPPEESESPEESEPAEREPRRRKPAGRRMVIAVAVAATLFVAAGAFGGAMLQPYLADRAAADTKLDIARTATAAITTLFTYTPEDMDQLSARSSKYLGGDLKDAYAKQVDALAATNKQNQIHRNAQVVGAAVESLKGPTATAMVYANITYTSAATKDVPKIFLVSYRLTMQRKGSNWLITNMPWITSKDLTRITP
jgi:Mce-associated membrane protein